MRGRLGEHPRKVGGNLLVVCEDSTFKGYGLVGVLTAFGFGQVTEQLKVFARTVPDGARLHCVSPDIPFILLRFSGYLVFQLGNSRVGRVCLSCSVSLRHQYPCMFSESRGEIRNFASGYVASRGGQQDSAKDFFAFRT